MQEANEVAIFLYLIGQTIAIWKKLSRIEQKINVIQERNEEQDKKLKKVIHVIVSKIDGAARELV